MKPQNEDIIASESKALAEAMDQLPAPDFKFIHTEQEKTFARILAHTDSHEQAYIGAGYPETYNITRRAKAISRTGAIRELRTYYKHALAHRASISANEVIIQLKEAIDLDPADFYDESGTVLPIHRMPKQARMWLTELQMEEDSLGKSKTKIKWIPKLAVFKELKELANLAKEHQEAGSGKTEIIWKTKGETLEVVDGEIIVDD